MINKHAAAKTTEYRTRLKCWHPHTAGTLFGNTRETQSVSARLASARGARALPRTNAGMNKRIYGVAAAVAAGEVAGAGEPKLKFTVGAFCAPCAASKNGRGANPNIPAIKFVGKLRTATL